jgi:hypothetical protein
VLFEHGNGDALTSEKVGEHHSGRAAADNAAGSWSKPIVGGAHVG